MALDFRGRVIGFSGVGRRFVGHAPVFRIAPSPRFPVAGKSGFIDGAVAHENSSFLSRAPPFNWRASPALGVLDGSLRRQAGRETFVHRRQFEHHSVDLHIPVVRLGRRTDGTPEAMKTFHLLRLVGLLMAALVLVSCATSGTTPSPTPSNVAPETNRVAPTPP